VARRKKLLEGFTKGAGEAVRSFFARSHEQSVTDIRRGGVPSVERAGLPYTLASHYGYDSLAEHLRIDQDLQARYTDYEEMDEFPEISVALDIYADDACAPNMDREQSIWVTSEDKAVADNLNDMLHKTLTIDDDIWGGARTTCKYGNNFGEILVNDQGVMGINYLPPPTMRRVEDPKGGLLGFLQDIRGEFNITMDDFYALAAQRGGGAAPVAPVLNQRNRAPGELTVFEDWEVVHWRLRGKHLRSVYGSAVIDPARWVWKRLSLLEDALLIYKLERAPSRYAFYVDVGQLDAERGLAHVNRVKNSFTRKKFVNPSTGKLDMRNNPLSHDEDFFVPVRDGKRTTEIDVLQGPDYTETDSLEYHRDKLVASLKIPKMYMGYGGEAVQGELSTQDIRFARTIMRVQQCLRGGYRKVCRVHLIASGQEQAVDKQYQVHMTVPSSILELARMEVMNTTADLASRMGELVSTRWLLVHLFKFSEEEAVRVMQEKNEERLKDGAVEAQVQKLLQSMDDETASGGAPPLVEGGRLERKLSEMIRAVPRDDWRREFDRSNRMAEGRAKGKLDRLIKENVAVNKRVRELGGLLMDIRKTMNAGISP
jgi:hypothetical protein